MNDLRVGVLVPSMGQWDVEFGRCLVNMIQWTTTRPVKMLGAKSLWLKLYTEQGSMLVKNRQKLVARAMKDGCTHMLFLDADMTFPLSTIVDLVKRDRGVVAANCVNRAFPVTWIARGFADEVVSSDGKHGLEEVQSVGCAVMMIQRRVVARMQVPLFMMEWIPELKGFCGEDVYFCAKVQQEARESVWVDHDLSRRVGHVGRLCYTPEMVGQAAPGLEEETVQKVVRAG